MDPTTLPARLDVGDWLPEDLPEYRRWAAVDDEPTRCFEVVGSDDETSWEWVGSARESAELEFDLTI